MIVKDLLKEARLKLLEVQEIVRPFDDRWTKLDALIEPLEKMITEEK